MKYLLDTCVLSEVIKPQPNQNVIYWLNSIEGTETYISALTLGEIHKGIEKASNATRRERLKLWVENDLRLRFKNHILAIDDEVATAWGAIQAKAEQAGLPMPVIDGLIAVTGLVHHCVVVTRNVSDLRQSGVELIDPWLAE